ncbi:MAG TPA: Maf family protein [Candidatus Binatia bacterium]|jgi:septum formation protein|nr:Maf family protein [Candidatus Binatia bacterium]
MTSVITNGRPIVLGTASPWRQKEMKAMGLAFTAMSPDIDEKAIRHPDPAILTLHIAVAKAAALLGRIAEPSLLVTCDQVAVFRGEVREKPADAGEARRWLAQYGGTSVVTVTTVVVTDTATRRSVHGVHAATAHFAPLPPKAIDRAIARGMVLNSCGAFTIDDPDLGPYVDGLYGEGDQDELRSSIAGLPRALTRKLLSRILG